MVWFACSSDLVVVFCLVVFDCYSTFLLMLVAWLLNCWVVCLLTSCVIFARFSYFEEDRDRLDYFWSIWDWFAFACSKFWWEWLTLFDCCIFDSFLATSSFFVSFRVCWDRFWAWWSRLSGFYACSPLGAFRMDYSITALSFFFASISSFFISFFSSLSVILFDSDFYSFTTSLFFVIDWSFVWFDFVSTSSYCDAFDWTSCFWSARLSWFRSVFSSLVAFDYFSNRDFVWLCLLINS